MPVSLHVRALQVAGAEGDLAGVACEGMRGLDICLGRHLGRHGECAAEEGLSREVVERLRLTASGSVRGLEIIGG